jgi:hypothetical protein
MLELLLILKNYLLFLSPIVLFLLPWEWITLITLFIVDFTSIIIDPHP